MATINSEPGQASDSGTRNKLPRLSGFTLLEYLYQGSHTSLYRARQDRLGRVVALKVLPEWPPPVDLALERFNRAAYVCAQVQHPNLVTLYDTGTRDGFHFVSLELLSGQTLQKLLAQNSQCDESFAIKVGQQICGALAALHTKEICHRNIKPKNIFVESNGNVRLIGLGLCSCKSAFFSPHLDSRAIGTPHYMAPEMIRGCYTDPRSDLYSLGVTLYLMTSGKTPFEKGGPAAVMSRHLTETPTPLSELRPQLSKDFVQVVNALLNKDPNSRFQSAKEAGAAFDSLAKSGSARVPHRSEAPVPTKPAIAAGQPSATEAHNRQLIGFSLAALGVSMVLLGIMLGITYFRAPEPQAPAQPAPGLAPNVSPAEPSTETGSPEGKDFDKLLSMDDGYRENPGAGVDAWSAYLQKYPTAPVSKRKIARQRLDYYLDMVNLTAPKPRERPAIVQPDTKKPSRGEIPAGGDNF